ncbi:MAG: hypothetical protein D6762_05420, partial [Candidatus Neomarinimicrobiota bacterium]
GFGTIVTGTVIAGRCTVGQELEAVPGSLRGKVRKLQTHGQDVRTVERGDRAALNLSNVDVHSLFRGSQIASPGWLQETTRLLAVYQPLPDTDLPKPRQRIRLHIGTLEVLGRIQVAGESRPGQFRSIIDLEKPVPLLFDDHLVVRTYSPVYTIGGGFILDPHPEGKRSRLKQMALEIPVPRRERLAYLVKLRGRRPQTALQWSRAFGIPQETLTVWVQEHSDLDLREEDVISRPALRQDRERVLAALADFHRRFPHRRAVPRERLKTTLGWTESWFALVVASLAADGVIRETEQGLALPEHNATLRRGDRDLVANLEGFWLAEPFRIASVKETAAALGQKEEHLWEFVHWLKEEGKLVRISEQYWVHRQTLDTMRTRLETFFRTEPSLSVAELKSMFGITRKTGIPLLEYFDFCHWTRREGNTRTAGEALSDHE